MSIRNADKLLHPVSLTLVGASARPNSRRAIEATQGIKKTTILTAQG